MDKIKVSWKDGHIHGMKTKAHGRSSFRVFKHSSGYIVASNRGRFHLLEFYKLDKTPRGSERIKFHNAW